MCDNTKLQEAFIRSTINVLGTLCGYHDISYELAPPQENPISNDIIGIMGINGNIVGTILIVVPYQSSDIIISKMTGSDLNELSQVEIGHGMAEVLNIICGNAKTILSETECSFNLTVPRILSCKECQIDESGNADSFGLNFSNGDISLKILIGYSINDKSENQAIEKLTAALE